MAGKLHWVHEQAGLEESPGWLCSKKGGRAHGSLPASAADLSTLDPELLGACVRPCWKPCSIDHSQGWEEAGQEGRGGGRRGDLGEPQGL